MSEPVFTSPASPAAPPHENVLGRRLVAALIDIAVLGVILVVFTELWGDSDTSDGSAQFQLNGWPALLFAIVALAYYAMFETALRQTPGKIVMSLEVHTTDGAPARTGAIALRTILRVIDGLPAFYLVGLIAAAVTKRNQRIGDLVAGTVVVRKGT
jgi:uncharacterized RDD family membrane protein YckC